MMSSTAARWSRPLAIGLIVLGLVIFGWLILLETTDPRYAVALGADRAIYRHAALQFLAGQPWFYPEQVQGVPYEVIQGHVMYPPVALLWLIPGAFLPDVLWYGIPLAIIVAIVVRHRPSLWGWTGITLCLAYPWTPPLLLSGNPGLWIAAACALGTVFRPAFALILAKPSLFAFALLGVRDRRWWVVVALGAIASLAVLPFTLQWIGVIVNARGMFSGPLYALRDVGLMALPVVAWLSGRDRPRLRAGGAETLSEGSG